MITETIVKPSSWVTTDVRMEKVRNLYLYKFSEALQNRLDNLNDRLKTNQLDDGECAELAEILDLDQIFTFLNAQIVAQS